MRVDAGKVLRGVSGPFSAGILAKGHVQHPVQLVFDAPVWANGAIEPRRIGFETGDVVTNFSLCFARCLVVPFALDAHQPLY